MSRFTIPTPIQPHIRGTFGSVREEIKESARVYSTVLLFVHTIGIHYVYKTGKDIHNLLCIVLSDNTYTMQFYIIIRR